MLAVTRSSQKLAREASAGTNNTGPYLEDEAWSSMPDAVASYAGAALPPPNETFVRIGRAGTCDCGRSGGGDARVSPLRTPSGRGGFDRRFHPSSLLL